MITFVDNFNFYWQFVMIISFIGGVVGFFFVKQAKTRKKQILGLISVAQIFLVWITFFQSMAYVQEQARLEVLNYLNETHLTIRINGNLLEHDQGENVLNELKKLRDFEAHNSQPTTQTDITISSGDNEINLTLKEDSEIPNEYWVFWDKYRSTKRSEIGRIRTEIIRKTLANST